MIDAAVLLIQQRGVSASGLQDIMAEASAPRGSIYHHFPGGKDELVVAALARVAEGVAAAIATVAERSETPGDFVAGVARVFRGGAERAGWTQGCPLAATAIEGDRQSERVRMALVEGLSLWREAVAHGLRRCGRTGDADQEAMMILAALEGGLLMARGLRSPEPYDAASAMLSRALTSD